MNSVVCNGTLCQNYKKEQNLIDIQQCNIKLKLQNLQKQCSLSNLTLIENKTSKTRLLFSFKCLIHKTHIKTDNLFPCTYMCHDNCHKINPAHMIPLLQFLTFSFASRK